MSISKEDLEYHGADILRWDNTAETAGLFVEEFFKMPVGQQIMEQGLKTKQAPQTPAEPQLTASQKAWQEFRIFTDSHSVQECKNRVRVDEVYSKFLYTNLVRQMNSGVGDAVEAVGTQAVRQDRTIRITQELNDFAWAYRAMSSIDVRKNSNLATNPNAASFNQSVADCIAAGLI